MPSHAPRQVFFYHIHKCGGTSLNNWMDLQVDDRAVWDDTWTKSVAARCHGERPVQDPAAFQAALEHVATGAFYKSDAVHSHIPMRRFAPAGVFSFTVLREPVSRVISQIADWRRLTEGDLEGLPAAWQSCIADTRLMPIKPFLEKHGRGAGRYLLDNHMVRALAASRLGSLARDGCDASELYSVAMDSLAQDFDLVGIAERDEDTRNAIAARAGWCPAPRIPRLNDTASAALLAGEAAESAALLEELTAFEAPLYAQAKTQFAARAQQAAAYDFARFESTAASGAVRRLRASPDSSSAIMFSVRQPLIGCGFHGRDAANTPDCAVWTGPAPSARLYMPVPPGKPLTLLVRVRGYAQESQRDRLRVRVDGNDAVHRFEPAPGYRDLIAVEARPSRDFVSLEIDVEAAVEPGPDLRLKGICFDQYGWCL